MKGWLRWLPGRLGSGYRKMLLAEGAWWDCYLIDYPRGAYVPFHHDLVPGKEHHRLNVTLVGDPARFVRRGLPKPPRRVVFFRPDVEEHAVQYADERRVVLSIGWVRAA